MIEVLEEKQLVKGNYAIAQAAVNAGLECYFGYPITPQSEIGEYLSGIMPENGKAFVSAESEVAAINMLIGAGSTGVKAMTSSSSCAIALMQEGLSYMAFDEVPCVLISVMRGGPGLGYIYPSQGDYFQATKGGGNGDYKLITYAPSTVQEAVNLTYKCFYVSQKYRTMVCLLLDGLIGQMMEPVALGKYPYPEIDQSSWALSGANGRKARSIKSLEPDPKQAKVKIDKLFEKYDVIQTHESMDEEYLVDDADIVITAFGSVARITKAAVKKARQNGMKVGLYRPIMLNPFPSEKVNNIAKKCKMILDIELNKGQMIQDVKASIEGATPVKFGGRAAGTMMTVDEIYRTIEEAFKELNEGAVCQH